MLKKDYGFHEAFSIFDERYNKRNKFNKCNSKSANKINTKTTMLEFLRITEDRAIYVFFLVVLLKK